MSTNWKSLTGELYDISYHEEESLTGELYDIHVPEVEKFNWRAGSTVFHVQEVEKLNWRTLLQFMSTTWQILAGELYCISCPRSGKV